MNNDKLMNFDYRNKSTRLPQDVVNKYNKNPIMQHFMLVSAGHRDEKHNIGHYLKRYSVDEYVLIYCIRGHGWVQTEQKRWSINPGEVLFCFKDSLHCYGADDEKPWEIYWSCFSGDDVPHRLDLYSAIRDNPVFFIGNNSKIKSLFSEILELLERGYALQHIIYASDCLQQILSSLCLTYSLNEKQNTSELVIENSINYMMENINGFLSLEKLSSIASMSTSYYGKFFQQRIGYPPIDYFIRIKMQKACTLLQTTSLCVKEISLLLGYNDVYYFSRIFKRKILYSPNQYRKLSLL